MGIFLVTVKKKYGFSSSIHISKVKKAFSDVSRENLGIAVLEKQTSVWEGGCCEPPVGLGQSTGRGPGSSAVFLIQNTFFILNLIISMMLIIQYL